MSDKIVKATVAVMNALVTGEVDTRWTYPSEGVIEVVIAGERYTLRIEPVKS